ncbi:hypothetical protein SUGI_0107550 [Cryptomeria japonica]|uniref:basic leucine zipper 10 n=1 Tax=Cryptomeria japonica TaxID=3369 RepID=UPI002408BB2B|nr:basic leucine zipper 10 [Cryptomeria japonica]GLJ09369.1 hypothetical protein SUGI_0107550 [Cryptomeria japonica]
MGSEASGPFSPFGAGRVIIKPGSDRFVPILPSSIGFQSSQMLACHSNQSSLHINSATPTHQAQFNDEVHAVFNAQYSNICIDSNSMYQPSSNLISCQTKPTKRSVLSVEKMGPSHDALNSSSSASGGNGETISPSDDEAENQHMIDERKQRRMLSNRESARRSRMRKQQRLVELKAQVDHLRAEKGHILNKFNITSQYYADITEENSLLRSQALELNQKLQQLHQTLNAQSHSGFRSESGHCNAASLSLESGNIDQFWASSDLLF